MKPPKRRRWPRRLLALAGFVVAAVAVAHAQDISISLGDETSVTERAVQLVGLLTVLSLAPSILMMVTSFTRIAVVLSLLRTAMGLTSAPPNTVMVGLALFLTFFIMQPVFSEAYEAGVQPVIDGTMELDEGFDRASAPFHAFMLSQVREGDVELFLNLSSEEPPETPEELSLRILVPAFMISELRRAFEIGFLLYLPFIIIDMVVASILMSMGMMMLPPVIVSLPFKLIFFVLVDGWNLVAGSLIRSFGAA